MSLERFIRTLALGQIHCLTGSNLGTAIVARIMPIVTKRYPKPESSTVRMSNYLLAILKLSRETKMRQINLH